MEDADFQLPQSFEQGAGRGDRILALSRYQGDVSLQRQLRMVQFPGFVKYFLSTMKVTFWTAVEHCH